MEQENRMYINNGMLQLGLGEDKEWPSSTHRIVAENACLMNPAIDRMDKMVSAIDWINEQDEEFLKTSTVGEMINAGADFLR